MSEKDKLAAFIGQRMEMGESEWCFDSPVKYAAMSAKSSPRGSEFSPVGNTGNLDTEEPADMPEIAGIGAQDTLESLLKNVCTCKRCALGSTRRNFVFGDGNPNADIMFIGEAPGEDEDKQGIPFVGRAGQLLNKMIEAIKLKREDVYIGNILKCRPPGNRDPKPEEIELCEPILIRQIELINPKIICALGRISGKTLLRSDASLSALRGTIHRYRGIKLIVTYHPAALLRNPNWKAPAWEDLKFLRYEYDGLEL